MNRQTPPLEYNKWNHIVGTYNGSNFLQLYYNGIVGSSFNTNGSQFNAASAGSLFIGGSSILAGNPGALAVYYIDEVRIYNRELTSGEVLTLYQGKTIQPFLDDRRSALVIERSGGY